MTKTTPQIAHPTALTNQFYSLFPKTLRDSIKAKPNEFMPTALKAKFDAVLHKHIGNSQTNLRSQSAGYQALQQEIRKLVPPEIQQKGDNSKIIDDFVKQYTDNYLARKKIPFYDLKDQGKKIGGIGAMTAGLGLTGFGTYNLIKGVFGGKKQNGKEEKK